MGSLGIWEIGLILLIVVVLFGASRLPQLGRALGEGITNFKRGLKSGDSNPSLTEPPDEEKD
ncbi:MAG: twin-arginine translocase TatA/TatE family subunit [bacterium]|nr:twin-arginine translocase TatA/TatE family subunit [bacterium]